MDTNPGLLIGIAIGAALGIAGGAFGTYLSIKNTDGPKERAFMVRVAIITWAAVSVFIAGLMLIPKPYNWLLWIPYVIALPVGIRVVNARQLVIRQEEKRDTMPR